MKDKFEALQQATREQGEFDAFLYDCDGTLADSMLPHKEAWTHEIQKYAPDISRETIHQLIDELAGMPGFKTIEVLNGRFDKTMDPHQMAKDKEQNFFENYIHRVTPIEFVVEHLKAQAALGKKIAVVSGGRTKVVNRILEILGIRSLVQVVICAEDVKQGKPDPEPFLMAAERLKVEPSKCLVLEDANMGVKAAEAAKMKWIRIDHIV